MFLKIQRIVPKFLKNYYFEVLGHVLLVGFFLLGTGARVVEMIFLGELGYAKFK